MEKSRAGSSRPQAKAYPTLALLLSALFCHGAEYGAPAGERFAIRRPGAASILPGGRVIAPAGTQYVAGPGAFNVAVSPNGRRVVSANGGPNAYSLTVIESDRKGTWTVRHLVTQKPSAGEKEDSLAWRSVFLGLAFEDNDSVYASDGNSGKVRLIDLNSGATRRVFDLNTGGARDSYTGDVALDRKRKLLHVLDQANFRIVTIDLDKRVIAGQTAVGRLPFALALSPDGLTAYVANAGMFRYSAIPGADAKNARETGLPFPAFGFPSAEAAAGARRETARGPVDVPGLGDPNAPESNSLAIVDLSDPATPKTTRFVRTGRPFGNGVHGGSGPSGVLAAAGRVFVANGHNDSITVLDPANGAVEGEIELRIPGLESLRGVLPIGMAYHEATGRLFVAEAGINAIGVIEARSRKVLGHIPAAWFPTRLTLHEDMLWVAQAKGQGTGPNVDRRGALIHDESFQGTFRRGAVGRVPLPLDNELAEQTMVVMQANGFTPLRGSRAAEAARPFPAAIRHVVLIVKENRTFDEMFGHIVSAANGKVMGAPVLARFGRFGYADGAGQRLSLQKVDVAPNHQAMAERWAFSDNFYADSEVSVDGHHWLVGSYPDAWTESTLMAAYGGQKDFRLNPDAPGRLQFPQSNSSVHPEEQLENGALWHHLERHGISFRNYGEGFELAGADEGEGLKPTGARYLTNVPMPDPLFRNTARDYPNYNMNIPDQFRADRFIADVTARFVKGGEPFPRFLYIHLPNDHMAKPRPEDGYPYAASYVADNDYALGRIVEFLSGLPQWREMAIFVTEDDAQGGRDHIDSHRTVFLGVGPWFKRNYVSHTNASFPGLLKTVFRLLGLPPLNLYDAAASHLGDLFAPTPDYTPYRVRPVDPRLLVPGKAREPMDPKPGPAMDDPSVLREQHRR